MYPTVKIYSTWWLAENLAEIQYDTQSERAGVILQSSNIAQVTPYYRNISNFNDPPYSNNLTSSDRLKLGFLYNFSAALGYENDNSQGIDSSTIRQGICPNGWNIASYEYLKPISHLDLKSTTGWYNDGNGDNLYGFNALPAGYASNNSYSLGDSTILISTRYNRGYNGFGMKLSYLNSDTRFSDLSRLDAFSCRCMYSDTTFYLVAKENNFHISSSNIFAQKPVITFYKNSNNEFKMKVSNMRYPNAENISVAYFSSEPIFIRSSFAIRAPRQTQIVLPNKNNPFILIPLNIANNIDNVFITNERLEPLFFNYSEIDGNIKIDFSEFLDNQYYYLIINQTVIKL